MVRIPTAFDVAYAIVAASKVTGCPPTSVIGCYDDARALRHSHVAQRTITRARAYAAMALQQLFAGNAMRIERLVNAPTPGSLLASLHQQRRRNTLNWFDADVLAGVVSAVLNGPRGSGGAGIQEITGAALVKSDPALPTEGPDANASVRPLETVAEPAPERPKFRIVEELTVFRKKFTDYRAVVDVTADLMGDPPPERSALHFTGNAANKGE